MKDYFKNRTILLATMHRKEQAIAPILSTIGLQTVVVKNLNTDLLGTFSGEIPRTLSPLEAAKQKCDLAYALNNDFDLVLASEGSYGPHPTIPFIPAGEELLYLRDYRHQLDWYVTHLTTKITFDAATIYQEADLNNFIAKVNFPTQGVILKITDAQNIIIKKDIFSVEELLKSYKHYAEQGYSISAETDMRAMHNPKRMEAIGSAATKLVELLSSLCPKCSTPGFKISATRTGLPCAYCGRPTKSVLAYIYACKTCSYQEEKKATLSKEYEEPLHCDFCNP